MLDDETYQLIKIASNELSLPPTVVEKDYYVTRILSALSMLKDDYSTLVFAGGTCLAKAHRLVKRMSEDVDFKFQRKEGFEHLSKNQYLKTLKNFRENIVSAVKFVGLIKEVAVRNEGRYLRLQIEYSSAFSPSLQLRPHLLLEFTASPLRLPTKILPITTMIQDTLGRNVSLGSATLTCISSEETAAEKWVGLTRRLAAIDRGYYPDDKTLIRHVYDLAAIRTAHPLESQFFSLVQEVIYQDANQFKNQYPEYFSDPIAEIERSLTILRNDPKWEERYNNFLIEMVYDPRTKQSYHEALGFIEQLSHEVIQTLSDMTVHKYALAESAYADDQAVARSKKIENTKKSYSVKVAEKIIEQLQQGVAPWQLPWKEGEVASIIPYNPMTNKRYKGGNAIYLMCQGRTDPRWMTYKQAQELNAQVRKGEEGTLIQYWKFSEEQVKTDENGKPLLDETGKKIKVSVALERPRLFYAVVFNAEQIEGMPPLQPTMQTEKQKWEAIERAENILKASHANIYHGEKSGAFYRPKTDTIHLPHKDSFLTPSYYYATALHELGHWTGHESRLHRNLINPFGSLEYAKEELRAEIASLILGNELNIGHDPNQHVAYVASWIKVLRDDPLELFRAAADAEEIHDYVLGFEQTLKQEQSHEKATATNKVLRDDNMPQGEQERVTRERIYINVPYAEKEQAKNLGARWDRKIQSWYIPHNKDIALFTKFAAHTPLTESLAANFDTDPEIEKRIYLAVPYNERHLAKEIGAKWDNVNKSWYVNESVNREQIHQWLPEQKIQEQMPALSPREEFAEVLQSLGCIINGEHPIMDGQKHRISVEGDKTNEQAGFYVGHLDGRPAGYVKNNRTGVEIKWKSKGYILTSEQKALLQAEAAQKLRFRTDEENRLHEKSAEQLAQQRKELLPISQHTPYLKTKGINVYEDIFTDKECLKTFIPLYDAQGKQWSVQTIYEDGTKRFAKNTRKEGCFHVIGGFETLSSAPVLVIAEGYATAATLSESLGFPTVTAFDAGNLVHVAKALNEKFPDKAIFIAGDNDVHLEATKGINPGKAKALEAAEAVKGKAIFPIFAPGEQANAPKIFTDFNDLAVKSVLGKESVGRQVKAVLENILNKYKKQEVIQQQVKQKSQKSSLL